MMRRQKKDRCECFCNESDCKSCFSVDEPDVSHGAVDSLCPIVSSPVQASSDTEMCPDFLLSDC